MADSYNTGGVHTPPAGAGKGADAKDLGIAGPSVGTSGNHPNKDFDPGTKGN